MINRNRLIIAALVLSTCISGCSQSESNNNKDEIKTEYTTSREGKNNSVNQDKDIAPESSKNDFEAILSGEKSFNTDDGAKKIEDIEFNDGVLYCFVDVDNDSKDELCLKGRTETFVIDKTEDGEFNEVYVGRDYDVPLNDGKHVGIYYYKMGAAPYGESYIFTTITPSGDISEVLNASWHDGNENGEMDDADLFYLDEDEEKEVRKKEWLDKAEEYVLLKETEVDWQEVKDTATK